jgi:major membrane immunogen (membrane-anchored lipoprotein)
MVGPQINYFNGGKIMKKIVSIIAIVTLSCSVAACARTNRRGTENNANNNAGNQIGTNQGTATGYDNSNLNATSDSPIQGNLTSYENRYNVGQRTDQPGFFDESATNHNTGTAPGANQGYAQGNTGYGTGNIGYDQGNIGYGPGNMGYGPDNTGYGLWNTGVAQGSPNNQNAQGNAAGLAAGMYTDGTFVGEGDNNSRASVTITGGRITDIVLTRADAAGNLIQDDNLNLGTLPGGGATSNVGQTTRSLANAMIQAQSPDIVTSTTGDTTTVNDMKLAVRRALERARK